MLTFDHIEIKVEDRCLFGVDKLDLKSGLVALVGRNGAGKSTFLKTIMGLHSNYTGSLKWNEKPLADFSNSERAKKMAIVYSKSLVFGKHTGRDVLMLGRLPYQNALAKTKPEDHKKVTEIVDVLNLKAFVDQPFSTLSDGEKQLVMIGRAMVQDTPIILLDEPGAFLDVVNKHLLIQVLKQIAIQTNKLVVFSTHDLNFLSAFCDAVLLIESGGLRLLDDPAEFLPEIHQSFGIEKWG